MTRRRGGGEDGEKSPEELAHQIIYGAVDYAASLEFRPHRDFLLSQHILTPREEGPPNGGLEFGKDGMPLYVSGPHDDMGRIVKHLEAKLGKDGFHYILVTGPLGMDGDFEH